MLRPCRLLWTVLPVMALAATCNAEMINAPANLNHGTATSSSYSGEVELHITGTASGLPGETGDAFYRPGFDPTRDVGYYLLSFNTSTAISSPTRDVANFVVGPLPAYNVSSDYDVIIDTGIPAASPQRLFFGFTDGSYNDNTGGYTITLTPVSVPEPASLSLLGVAGIGLLVRRKAGNRKDV